MSLPTLADLKVHLDITRSTNDAELSDFLDAAVDAVEGIVGPLTTRTVTETHYGSVSNYLMLRQMPAVELVSVSSRSGSSLSELPAEDHELDSSGLLRRADGVGFYGTYAVTYTVGRPTVPAAIRTAILIIAAHLWETQRGTSPSALALQQPGEDFGAPVVAGYAIPNRARDLLARYAQVSIA